MKNKLLFPLFIYFFSLSGGRGLLEKYMDCGESNVSAAEDYDYRWVGNLMQNRGPQREREREREIHTHSLHLYISISLYLFISPSLHLWFVNREYKYGQSRSKKRTMGLVRGKREGTTLALEIFCVITTNQLDLFLFFLFFLISFWVW